MSQILFWGKWGLVPAISWIGVDKVCQVCTDIFHLLAGIRITVWNTVNNFVEIVVFFDNVECCTEVDIEEVCNVGYPVIHSGDAVGRVDALVFENSVVDDGGNFLGSDFFSGSSHKNQKIIF